MRHDTWYCAGIVEPLDSPRRSHASAPWQHGQLVSSGAIVTSTCGRCAGSAAIGAALVGAPAGARGVFSRPLRSRLWPARCPRSPAAAAPDRASPTADRTAHAAAGSTGGAAGRSATAPDRVRQRAVVAFRSVRRRDQRLQRLDIGRKLICDLAHADIQADLRGAVKCEVRPDSIGRSTSRCRGGLRDVAHMQARPIQAIHQRGKLRGGEPHHAIADRRPAERRDARDASTEAPVRTRPKPKSSSGPLASNGRQKSFPKTGHGRAARAPARRGRRRPCENRPACVATMTFTPAEAAIMSPPSRPAAHRAARPGRPRRPREPPRRQSRCIDRSTSALPPAGPAPRGSVTTGTKSGASSAGRLSAPARAALRHANRCWGAMSCRRATSDTTAPGAYDSATICPLALSLHRRRRPTPTWISTRPRRSKASTIWSTIYANRSGSDDLYLQDQAIQRKVGSEHRLPTLPELVDRFPALAKTSIARFRSQCPDPPTAFCRHHIHPRARRQH